jgi:succinate dehydrogenase / fumarate reductase, cytochrome b subunit
MNASAAIHPKGPRLVPEKATAVDWAESYLASTVGQKILVAVTGLSLGLFVLFHMIGNLKMFHGPESINQYAYFLKHDLGALIWIARGGLLSVFVVHLFLTIRLKLRASAARPIGYTYAKTAQASPASMSMIWTGFVIGAFVLFHLAHFTFAMVHDVPTADGKGMTNYLDLKYRLTNGKEVHDVYAMVLAGFRTPWISVIYLIAQGLLFVHLSHGFQSSLTTLGVVSKRFQNLAKLAGIGLAAAIVVGNFAIVLAVWLGHV